MTSTNKEIRGEGVFDVFTDDGTVTIRQRGERVRK